jgi:hypothetical protein
MAEIVPEFGVHGKQQATIAHLLTHTGGTWAGLTPPPPGQWGRSWGDLDEMTRLDSAQQTVLAIESSTYTLGSHSGPASVAQVSSVSSACEAGEGVWGFAMEA